ncbi:hypothetical protein CAI21_22155 [Alkalilimnicola ehrlichii]|uniref:ParB-like N-terminal domain-containing protein n=1 Tax=Alkalilimnicola ehrlichii TaxID=351052 RepID=A0A3E0WF40_9GAMM|nr:ParB/RepB/Spo0J family partition protein [Alkalilimnicola ehrlichii]RFA24308.1 hypothetical protein CAI21_22155 [Alkalilimnicola ehrlichii]RFA31554.1 hypothetical protein CAL65_22300 [Alkalilimnicola ehrlichii]
MAFKDAMKERVAGRKPAASAHPVESTQGQPAISATAGDVIRHQAEDSARDPDALFLRLDQIVVTSNVRQDFTHVDDSGNAGDNVLELVASIRRWGQLQSIVVADREDGRYELIAGETRYRALTLLHEEDPIRWPGIAARRRPPVRGLERELAQYEETMKHYRFKPLDEAAWMAGLMREHNLSQAELAQRLGHSPARVSKLLKLLDLPDEVQAAVRDGELSVRQVTEGDYRRFLTSQPTSEQESGPVAASTSSVASDDSKPPATLRVSTPQRIPRVPVPLDQLRDVVQVMALLAKQHGLNPIELRAKPTRKDLLAVIEQRVPELLEVLQR